jgi:2-polyprenyl-6-methoxyphenol hydroxylase-like FAD-dependent oxidoreductase
MDEYDVVIAGAGPVGLALAGELRLHGVSTLVVERLTGVDPTVKAGSINLPTAEAAYRRGLLPPLARAQEATLERMRAFLAARPAPERAEPPKTEGAGSPKTEGAGSPKTDGAGSPKAEGAGSPKKKPVGHFAGLWDLDLDQLPPDPDWVANPASQVYLVAQQAVEQVFGEWAAGLGAELRRGVELTGLADDGDGVTVELDGVPAVRASWLVGCDGGRSAVRKLAGFAFPGTEPSITGHQAVVELDHPEWLPSGWNRVDGGMLVHGPGPGRVLTVEYDGPPADRDAPITAEELQGCLRRLSGTGITVTGVTSATRFTDNARQVPEYRKGRVLLAGDAAHVHSPFGGQGLNLGVGDAVNLGWKLAAAVAGWAPEGLLDTYTTERHPVGAWVLDWNRAQVALMRPDPKTTALRSVVGDLMRTVDGNAYFLRKLSGQWIDYDFGGGHRLTGHRAPDLTFADGTRLAEHCHDGRPLLVDLTGEYAATAAPWAPRVRTLRADCPDTGLAALLVRPDGHLAWAADRPANPAADPTADPTADPAANPTADRPADPTANPTADRPADRPANPADPAANPTANPTADRAAEPGASADLAGLTTALTRWFGTPVPVRA